MSRNKYYAIPSYYSPQAKIITSRPTSSHDLRFDSKFECQVYASLAHLTSQSNLHRQVPLLIKPKTRFYRALFWKCDFRIYHPTNKALYWNIEAKGLSTREFLRNLQYLEIYSPEDWERLIIVSNEPIKKIDALHTSWSLAQLENFLLSNNFVEG